MVLDEFAKVLGPDTSQYDWVLNMDLGDHVKFLYYVYPVDRKTHISPDGTTTLCNQKATLQRNVGGEIWYCDRCLLHHPS